MKQVGLFNLSVAAIYLLYVYIHVVACAKGTDDSGRNTNRISKRNEADLQFCVDNFDIQEDTIIRTQDSRAMGAKYINETDLSSRDECLKLCCETTSCDVFVFEEKSPGSCYLFNCGPSDDFKCKFDQHTQYTSAILAVSRHAAELESEIQHSKHEQELTKLRVMLNSPEGSGLQAFEVEPPVVHTCRAMPNDMLPSTPSPPAFISTLPPPPKEASQPALPLNTTLTKAVGEGAVGSAESVAYGGGSVGTAAAAAGGRGVEAASSIRPEKCSRYQFECRSTGECIAIYNACDGIPQCADGSDEGSELDCPSSASTSPLARPRGPEETGHIHSHPHQLQKVAAVTTAGAHSITPPPSPQVSSQVHHMPPAIESYLPVRGLHGPQSVPSSLHQVPAQPQQFQPSWVEQQQRQQQQQQLQLQAQYHAMGNSYNAEGGEARPPQYPPQHIPQQQTHMGYQGENFPLSATTGLRERPQSSQGSVQWPPLRSEPPLPPSPLGQEWYSHPPNDGGNLGPRYEESGQNRHIFNHKGSGLVADSDRYFHMRSHLNKYNIPYGDGNQGDYNTYANSDSKNYIGSNENYFSTPYRQPVQPNWPLLHPKIATSGDPRQMGEPGMKDPREEIGRKHGSSSPAAQSLPLPNAARGDYPPLPLQSGGGGDGHTAAMGVPIPPDYFYEDGLPGGHHPSPHRGRNYQRVDPANPNHTPEQAVQQKPYDAHYEAPAAQHMKQKSEAKEVGEGDEEEETLEAGSEGGETDGQREKSQQIKATTTLKPDVVKQPGVQHQNPIHMSLKHENPQANSEDSSDVPDGESSRPKGAVLSLTLGMGITAIMVALMAWRLRVIKRRLRRGGGKSPYAHDADYLLNGMYL